MNVGSEVADIQREIRALKAAQAVAAASLDLHVYTLTVPLTESGNDMEYFDFVTTVTPTSGTLAGFYASFTNSLGISDLHYFLRDDSVDDANNAIYSIIYYQTFTANATLTLTCVTSAPANFVKV